MDVYRVWILFMSSRNLENIGIRSIFLGNWIAGFKGKVEGQINVATAVFQEQKKNSRVPFEVVMQVDSMELLPRCKLHRQNF